MSSAPPRKKLAPIWTPDSKKTAAEKTAERAARREKSDAALDNWPIGSAIQGESPSTTPDPSEQAGLRLVISDSAAPEPLPPLPTEPSEPLTAAQVATADTAKEIPSTTQQTTTTSVDQSKRSKAGTTPSRRGIAATAPRRPGRPARKARAPKPPEAEVPYHIYERLRDFAAAEKAADPVTARPHGVIVMDAIERHAEVLASRWQVGVAATPAPGALFIRTDTKVGARHRKQTTPMHPVTMAGVSPENRDLIDRLVSEWNAGSRAALVEEALRLEFRLPRSDDPSENGGS